MERTCDLRAANGAAMQHCDGEQCVYWRVIERLGRQTGSGCAVEHFELLGEDGMAEWLLSVKERIESRAPLEDPLGDAPTSTLGSESTGRDGSR